MTVLEYRNSIASAIGDTNLSNDPITIVRNILNSCNTDFPYGECRGILKELSENHFTRWEKCTYEEATNYANDGVPTVGISDNQVIVIAPNDSNQIESNYVREANTLTSNERNNLEFFSYSKPLSEVLLNNGSVSVSTSTLSDGFSAWYYPSCQNKGVTDRVPRFLFKQHQGRALHTL